MQPKLTGHYEDIPFVSKTAIVPGNSATSKQLNHNFSTVKIRANICEVMSIMKVIHRRALSLLNRIPFFEKHGSHYFRGSSTQFIHASV